MNVTKLQRTINGIREYIAVSGLSAGDRIPSVREFAQMFAVSRHTAYNAVEELKYEGIIDIKQNSGMFLSQEGRELLYGREIDWNLWADYGLIQEDSSENVKNHPELTLTHYSIGKHFGVDEVLKKSLVASAESFNGHPGHVLDNRGLPELRTLLREHLKGFGLDVKEDEILLVSGINEALMLIKLAFMRGGVSYVCDKAMINDENPTFRALGISKIQVDMDDEGMMPDKLMYHLRHNKRSIVLSAMGGLNPFADREKQGIPGVDRRRELFEICKTANVPFVETDIFRDITPNAPSPIKTLDRNNSVIYIGSFTKILSANFRLGWIVAGKRAVGKLANLKGFVSSKQDLPTQLLALEMMKNGYYQEYLAKLLPALKENKRTISAIMNKHMTGIAGWNLNSFGYTMYIKFFENTNVNKMYNNSNRYVTFTPGRILHPDYEKFSPVSITALQPDEFEQAVIKLAELTKRYTN